MSKTRKVFSTLLGTLLLVAVGAGTATAVFVFTDAGPYLFGSKTVIESKDEENKSRLDQTNKQLTEVDQELKNLEAESKTTQTQIEATQNETKEVQKTLEEVKASNTENKKQAKNFTNLKNRNFKELKKYQGLVEKFQPLHAQLTRARNAVHTVQSLLRKLEEYEGREEKHRRVVTIKWLEEQRAAKYNWSFIKEFFIYTLGLKILWGLFTGYKASTSTYYAREDLKKAVEEYEKERLDLNEKIDELRHELDDANNLVLDAFKKADQQAIFDQKLRDYLTKEMRNTFTEGLNKYLLAREQYQRALRLLDLKMKETVGRQWLDPEERKQLEEVGKPSDSGAEIYTYYQTSVNEFKAAKAEFEETFVKLESKFNTAISEKVNLTRLKQQYELYKEKEKLYNNTKKARAKTGGGA